MGWSVSQMEVVGYMVCWLAMPRARLRGSAVLDPLHISSASATIVCRGCAGRLRPVHQRALHWLDSGAPNGSCNGSACKEGDNPSAE